MTRKQCKTYTYIIKTDEAKVIACISNTYDATAMAIIIFSPSLTAVVIATLSAHVESG